MKKFLLFLSLAFAANAQNIVSVTASTTPVVALTNSATVKLLTLTATTASSTLFRFYDTKGTSTNYVVAGYSRPISYATNYNVVFTNANGIVITNTFAGIYTTTEVVSVSTNQRPILWSITIPGNSTRTIDVTDRPVVNGLLVVANNSGIAEIEYE